MKKYIILAMSLPLLLSGCLSYEELEARKQQHCASMGAPIGSHNYYNCRQSLEARLEREYQAAVQRAAESWAPRPTPREPITIPPAYGSKNIRCRSYAMGDSINTDCN